jgi:hypothetical protein
MPFIDEGGAPLKVIPLTQAPATGPYFQLNRPIGFREHEDSEILWIPAHVPAENPEPGNRTDLATVPLLFRSFVASYGRQSAPAIMHDYQRGLTSRPESSDQLSRAEADDRLFRVGLRHQKVPLLRAWLMWTVVSVERYWLYARIRALLLVLQAGLGVAVIYSAVVLAFASPLWLLGVAPPALAALAWGRHYVLMLWFTYGSALVLPFLLLQICALAPYRLVELLVRETIDRPFLDHHPGPVVVPYGRAPD